MKYEVVYFVNGVEEKFENLKNYALEKESGNQILLRGIGGSRKEDKRKGA